METREEFDFEGFKKEAISPPRLSVPQGSLKCF